MQAVAVHGGGAIEILPKRTASAVAFGVALAFAGLSTALVAVATGIVLAAAERDRKNGRPVSAATKVIRALAVVGGYATIVVVPILGGVIGTHLLVGLFIIPLVVRAERVLGEGTPDEVRAARKAFYISGLAVAVIVTVTIAALAMALLLR